MESIDPQDRSPLTPVAVSRFFITPDPGYHIDVMTIDGTVIPATPGYQISNVNSDHTISVTFARDLGSVMVRSDPNGATIFIDGVESGTTPNNGG